MSIAYRRLLWQHQRHQAVPLLGRLLEPALAIGGHVLDVSKSLYLYGPKAPRAMYAGRAITRAAALRKADDATVARGDDIADFSEQQLRDLRERVEFYLSKFPKIALLESWLDTHGSAYGAQQPQGE